MGSGKSIEDKVVGSAAAALGIKHADELVKLDRRSLARFTQKQLFEFCVQYFFCHIHAFTGDKIGR